MLVELNIYINKIFHSIFIPVKHFFLITPFLFNKFFMVSNDCNLSITFALLEVVLSPFESGSHEIFLMSK